MKYLLSYIIFIFIVSSSRALHHYGENVCSDRVSYTVTYNVRTTYYVSVSYRACCAHWLFCWNKCTKSRRELRYTYVVQTSVKYKYIYRCCSGYRQKYGYYSGCSEPICPGGCLHGYCAAPGKCKCFAGFEGRTCSKDINECITNNKCEQDCRNTKGSYVCRCLPGYTRSTSDNHKCSNLNECVISSNLCECADKSNNLECSAKCVDTPGSYFCNCSEGYSLFNSRICTDTDECVMNIDKCEHKCINTGGSYKCLCEQGYQLDANGRNCFNINECLTSNGGCEHTCNDTPGSYYCLCSGGMKLDDNGKTCSWINQCLLTNHGCQQKCVNERSHYKCTCREGYKLNNDNKTCSDENECLTGSHLCSQICENEIGNYTCKCGNGFVLENDGKTCKDINECNNTLTNQCNQVCINTPGSYQCFCNEGYQLKNGNYTCTGLPCQDMTPIHHGNATCLTGVTDDTCSFQCKRGFNLEGSNQRTCGVDHKWNGTSASCMRRSCHIFEPPLFGSVSLPCANIFKAECEVSCMEGYYAVGNEDSSSRTLAKCSVSHSNEMVWSDNRITCKTSEACIPNPCHHYGICKVETGNQFTCKCDGTGYIGDTCEIGIIELVQIPILGLNKIRRNLMIFARPEQDLTIHISTNTKFLTVEPQNVTLTNVKTLNAFSLTGKLAGYFKMTFSLSGKSANDFRTPQDSVVFVDGNYTMIAGIASPVKADGTLKTGCYDNSLESTGREKVTVTSSMKWTNGETYGVLQADDRFGNSIPLSLSGGVLKINGENSRNKLEVFDINTITTSTDGKAVVDKDCFSSYSPSEYAGPLLKTNAFLYSVQNLFNKNFPFWFKVYAKLSEDEYDTTDLGGGLFHGSELESKESLCTKGFTFKSNDLYYLYSTRKTFYVFLPHKNLTLPSSYLKCFIKHLETSETIFVYTRLLIDELKENILSVEVSKLLRASSGLTDRIGFVVGDSGNPDSIHSYGQQTILLKNTHDNASIKMVFDGRFDWNVNNLYNLFDKDFIKNFSAADGNVNLQIQLETLGDIQEINIQGKLQHFQRVYSDTQGGFLVHASILPKNITFSANLDKILTLQKDESIQLIMEESGSQPTFSISEGTKRTIKNLAIVTGGTHTAKNFLLKFQENLDYSKYTWNETTQLIQHLTQIISLSSQLWADIDSATSMSKQMETTVAIRTHYLNAVKRFQVFVDAHLRYDLLDFMKVEMEFIKFKDFVDHIIKENFDFNIEATTSSENLAASNLRSFEATTKGQVCMKTICISNQIISISYNSPLLADSPFQGDTKNHEVQIKLTIEKETQLGGLIKLPVSTNILIVCSKTTNAYISYINGRSRFYEQTFPMQAIILDDELRFQKEVKFSKNNTVLIKVTASLKSINIDDPILFVIQSYPKESNEIPQKVKKSIKDQLTEKSNNLKTRYENNKETLVALHSNLNNISTKVRITRSKIAQLRNFLNDFQNNISQVNASLMAVKQRLNLKIQRDTEKTQTLFSQCEPRICSLTCIPGLLIYPCQSNVTKHTIENKCVFKEVEKQSYKTVRVHTMHEYLDFDVVSTCHKKCTGIVGLSNKKKRKRRAIGAIAGTGLRIGGEIVLGAVTKTVVDKLEEYGGIYTKIGSFVGKVFGGPIGSLIGATIGVIVNQVIGGCNVICKQQYFIKVVQVPMSDVKRIPYMYKRNESDCHNEQTIVNIGFGVLEKCTTYHNCSSVTTNSTCLEMNEKCVDFQNKLLDMRNSTLSDEISITFNNYKKLSMKLNLLDKLKQEKEGQYKNLEGMLEIDSAIMSRIDAALKKSNNSYQKFSNSIRMWEKVEERIHQFDSNPLICNSTISFISGMQFPQRMTVDFNGYGIKTSSLFDTSSAGYENSVYDAARKILTALKIKEGGSPFNRKRRSIGENIEPTITQIEEKCLILETAMLYWFGLLEKVQLVIGKFKNQTAMYEDFKHRTFDDKKNLMEKASMESQNIITIESDLKDINNIIAEIKNTNSEDEKFLETIAVKSWNDVMTHGLLEFQNITTSEDCFSIKDCLLYHFDEVNDRLKYENNTMALKTKSLISNLYKFLLILTEKKSDIDHTQQLLQTSFHTLMQIKPIDTFCGNKPLIKVPLNGVLHFKEDDTLQIPVELEDSTYPMEIEWNFNNKILENENKTYLVKRKVSTKDNGYYSCKVTNQFGTSYCGFLKVIIYKKPVFLQQPAPVNTYINSPIPSYLFCNVTEGTDENTELEIQWLYHSFNNFNSTIIPSPNKTFVIVPNYNTEMTGYYYCKVTNRKYVVESKKTPVNVLSTSVLVEKLNVTMSLGEMNSNHSRGKRSESQDTKSKIATIMLLNNTDIHDLKYNLDSANKTLHFLLKGKDFSENLHQLDGKNVWEEIPDMKIKDRDDMILRAMLLYQAAAAENSTFTVQINSVEYEIIAASIKIVPAMLKCPYGQTLLENGYICGDCPAGSRYNEEDGDCIPCEKDTYQPEPKQNICLYCATGLVTESLGSMTAIDCVEEVKTTATSTSPLTTFTKEVGTSSTKVMTETVSTSDASATNASVFVPEKSSLKYTVIGLVVSILVILIFVVVIYVLWKKRQKKRETENRRKLISEHYVVNDDIDGILTDITPLHPLKGY